MLLSGKSSGRTCRAARAGRGVRARRRQLGAGAQLVRIVLHVAELVNLARDEQLTRVIGEHGAVRAGLVLLRLPHLEHVAGQEVIDPTRDRAMRVVGIEPNLLRDGDSIARIPRPRALREHEERTALQLLSRHDERTHPVRRRIGVHGEGARRRAVVLGERVARLKPRLDLLPEERCGVRRARSAPQRRKD